MKKLICIMLTTVFFCIISTTSYSAEVIKKDQPAPNDGVLLTHEENLTIKLEIIELDKLKEDKITDKKEIEHWQTNYFKLSDRYIKQTKSSNWQTTLYFIGGLALGAGAVYLGGKVAKEI